jgi:hypothetical protein
MRATTSFLSSDDGPSCAAPAVILRLISLSSLVRTYVLELVAVALVGSTAASSGPLLAYVCETGANPEATVYGRGRVTDAASAALANGTLAHTLELDGAVCSTVYTRRTSSGRV